MTTPNPERTREVSEACDYTAAMRDAARVVDLANIPPSAKIAILTEFRVAHELHKHTRDGKTEGKVEIDPLLYDGMAVYVALGSDPRALARTSAENVADVLDAIVRIKRAKMNPQTTNTEER